MATNQEEVLKSLKQSIIDRFVEDRSVFKVDQGTVLGAYQAVLVELWISVIGVRDAACFFYSIADDLATRSIKDKIKE